MSVNDTQQSTGAFDVVAVLDKEFNQVFPDLTIIKATVKEESKPFEHPLETGALVTDHRIIQPIEIELSALVMENFRKVYQQAKSIYLRGDLMTVQTKTDSYPSMLISSMPHEESGDMLDGIMISMSLKEAKFIDAEFKEMEKGPAPKPASKKNSNTVKRGEQRPNETPPEKKSSFLSKIFKK